MKKSVNEDLKLISGLRFFSSFSEENLFEIIDASKVCKFRKSQNIFFADDKTQNFYIVAAGAIKLTVIEEDGKEAVLQIVEAGGFLNDVFGDVLQSNAKAITNCVVISFPIQKARELLCKVPAFGMAILQETANRNKILMSQLGNLRLNNSKKKVGQFLLEMAFGEGAKKSTTFDIKYEKSVIASYLGINPETLSRTLQKLKDLGEIEVNKNCITLPKADSLCGYCNSEIAEKCVTHKADFCKHA